MAAANAAAADPREKKDRDGAALDHDSSVALVIQPSGLQSTAAAADYELPTRPFVQRLFLPAEAQGDKYEGVLDGGKGDKYELYLVIFFFCFLLPAGALYTHLSQ